MNIIIKQTFDAQLNTITGINNFIDDFLNKHNIPLKIIKQIKIAVDEIFSNIVKYGYDNKGGKVDITLIKEEKEVNIIFKDYAKQFNPLHTDRNIDITLDVEDREIGGLGLFIVKNIMDDIKYKYEEGNKLTLIKKL